MKNLTPVTREEKFMDAIAKHEVINLTPTNDTERLLDSIMRDSPIAINPKTRTDYFIAKNASATILGEPKTDDVTVSDEQ